MSVNAPADEGLFKPGDLAVLDPEYPPNWSPLRHFTLNDAGHRYHHGVVHAVHDYRDLSDGDEVIYAVKFPGNALFYYGAAALLPAPANDPCCQQAACPAGSHYRRLAGA